ncbi:MAG: NAD(P)/FAD-dependent oxidoreductase [Microbacteriaceae bacterium]
MSSVIIVGASVAGWHTAAALRTGGFDGDITLVERTKEWPYDRPPLSKGIMTGAVLPESIRFATPDEIAALNITCLLGTEAVSLRPDARRIDLANGESLGYDAVVIATGLQAPEHPLLAQDLPGVYQLRHLADALTVRDALQRSSQVVVVGGGFIGSEIASAARQMSKQVVLLEADDEVGARALGVHAIRLRVLHDTAGVEVRTCCEVTSLIPMSEGTGVQLADGQVVHGDAVFLGLGSVPSVGWLAESGLATEGGVASDAFGRTGHADVYVAGDVGAYESPWAPRPRRFQHWSSAVERAESVAALILEREPPPLRPPYFWFDVHGHRIQAAGAFPVDSRIDVLQEGGVGFLAVHRQGERAVGVIAIDEQREFARNRRSLVPPLPEG